MIRKLHDLSCACRDHAHESGWEGLLVLQHAPFWRRVFHPSCPQCSAHSAVGNLPWWPPHTRWRCTRCGWSWILGKSGRPIPQLTSTPRPPNPFRRI